jgi:hypothetical protein
LKQNKKQNKEGVNMTKFDKNEKSGKMNNQTQNLKRKCKKIEEQNEGWSMC